MEKPKQLRALLEKIVEEETPQGILLSAGLDTTLLAFLLRKRKLTAITVGVGRQAPDLSYSRKLAKKFGWKHLILQTDFQKLLKEMPETIQALKSFDPMTLRNNVVIALALKKAKALRLKSVLTGDGGDELFAGYRFIFEKKPQAMLASLRRMWKIMHFASHTLGEQFKIKVISPYLDKRIQNFASKLSSKDFVCELNGQKFGKAILRFAFEKDLPKEFVWRVKTPIQDGSGSSGLTGYLEEKISDIKFKDAQRTILQRDKVKIRNKEQLAYYQIYRKFFPSPAFYPQFSSLRRGAPKKFPICPDCHSPISPPEGKFCRTCGLWPAC